MRFYRDGLGFEVLYEFRDHDRFDGVTLGYAGAAYHLEFTRKAGHRMGKALRTWVRANGCGETPATDVLSDGRDGLRVTRRTYGAGRDGAEVVLVVIEGGGHTWPRKKSTASALGRSTLTVSANDLMWEFLQKHRLT